MEFLVKVLITGINGFTGYHLSNFLKLKNFEIFGLSSKKTNKKNIFTCDIRDKADLKNIINKIKPDYIIHLAAISYINHSNIKDIYDINVIGTQNLLESINFNIKKIIISSSAHIYGIQKKEILNEKLCPNPNTHYGLSKFATEQIAKNFFDKFNIIITRPFNYTGIYQSNKFLIPKIITHYKKREKNIHLGNLNVIREINSIEYVCNVYEKLLKNNINNEIINICTSRGIYLKDIIKIMNEISGYKINIIEDQKLKRKNEMKKLIGDNTKLKHYIGEIKDKPLKNLLKDMYDAWVI